MEILLQAGWAGNAADGPSRGVVQERRHTGAGAPPCQQLAAGGSSEPTDIAQMSCTSAQTNELHKIQDKVFFCQRTRVSFGSCSG